MFNYEEYSKVWDDFLNNISMTQEYKGKEIQNTITGICTYLKIAYVEVNFYENARDEALGTCESIKYFQVNMADKNQMVTKRFVMQNGNIAIYKAYAYDAEREWSAVEKQKVELLLKMLFQFNYKVKLSKKCSFLENYDRDLSVPNLPSYLKFISQKIARHKIGDYCGVFFNLNRFSSVNQLIGRNNADIVMKEYILLLQSKTSKEEMFCRVGGDNFAGIFYKSNLEAVKECLQAANITYDYDNKQSIVIGSTAGIYVADPDCKLATDFMDNAITAYSVAKNVLKIPAVFFSNDMMKNVSEKKEIETIFPEAIANEQFLVYYQPKVNLKNYKLKGAEALCRWMHDGELIQPDKFIPVFEQSLDICVLDFYMLDHVCRDIRRWLDEGKDVVKISVNLSRKHLGDPELVNKLLNVIDKYEIPHQYIEIELTETTTDADFKDLKKIVCGLKKAGVSTSVDDFGIGYSSLNLIRELPWSVLKIDKSFLQINDDDDSQNRVMLKHIISMATELGLECIVEGVETTENVKLLKENGCFMAQGYYFDRPLPVDVFEQRLVGAY